MRLLTIQDAKLKHALMESMHENQCKKLLISIENCEIMGDIVLGMELVIWNYSESADLTLSHDKVQECIGL